jgi:hypothetical protein
MAGLVRRSTRKQGKRISSGVETFGGKSLSEVLHGGKHQVGFLLVNGKFPVGIEQGAFHELGEGKGFARCEVHGYGNRFGGVFHASIVRLNCETTQALISLTSAFVSKPFLFEKPLRPFSPW